MVPRLGPVFYVIGFLLVPLGAGMTIPAIVDAADGNRDWEVFMTAAGVTVALGGMLVLTNRGKRFEVERRQAFLLAALSWAVLPAFAALPFCFAGIGMSFTAAYFEAMSGFTTTGSTMLSGIDKLSSGILLWRALLQLYGGAGIIVIAIAVLPLLRVGGMQLFRLESSEQGEKVLPRTAQIATMTVSVYASLVVLNAIAYWAAGMSFFDAVCHAMATFSTGGFSTHDASIGYFNSLPIEAVGTLFMFLGGVPIVLFYRLVKREVRPLYADQQVRLYLLIALTGIGVLGLWRMLGTGASAGEAFRGAGFNFVSMLTGTGLSSTDYWHWGAFADIVLLLGMLIGGCTGSTSGAIKVFRFNMLGLAINSQFRRLMHPHAAVSMLFNGRPVPESVAQSALLFVMAYLLAFVVLTLAIAGFGYDLTTSASAVATSMGNVGGGLGEIISGGTFTAMPDGATWILSAAMLLGRLELFTVLIIFTRRFWRG